jgi:D-alanyl-D-alanine carboxypeptidase (penicillin-binding protein 5/6)
MLSFFFKDNNFKKGRKKEMLNCFVSSKKLRENMLQNGFFEIKKILCLLSCCGIFHAEILKAAPLPCEVTAPVALLINAENGKVLFAKNADTLCYPASTTKIATALYALHRKEDQMQQKIIASADAVGSVSPAVRRNSGKHPSYRLEFGGTHIGLKVGEEMSFESLMHGLLLTSGNDAANVIAEFVSGSIPQFLTEMNAYLREIGCTNTHFTTPHGLPDLNHVTTAKDLALMAQKAMKNPFFKKTVACTRAPRPATNKQPESILPQNNALIKPKSSHYYPYATGIKTGWTIRSGYTIVASAEKGDRSLIAVVCHFEGLAQRYKTAIHLFETAFNEVKQSRKLFAQEYDLFQHSIEGAKTNLKGILQKDVIVSFYPSEESSFSSELLWDPVSLPIRAGDKVGSMNIFDDQGALKESVSIIAMQNVEPTFFYQVKELAARCSHTLSQYRKWMGYALAAMLLGGSLWKWEIRHRRKLKAQKGSDRA